jgi:fibronectin type 3 domain-containing protein
VSAVILCLSVSAVCVTVQGQSSGDPSTLPLVQASQLTYVGGFRLPEGTFGSQYGYSYGQGPIAYDPATNALFLSGHPYEPTLVSQVSIPTPVNTSSVNQMATATVLQDFVDVTEGNFDELSGGQTAYLGGLLVANGTLYGTGYIFYDANLSQVVSHFSHSTTLSTPSFQGFASLVGIPQAGYVSGWMTSLPAAWQTVFNAEALTGNCCLSIIGRTSLGPDAFAFDLSKIATGAAIPATALTYYTLTNPTLGPWSGSNSVYGGTTKVGGMVAVAGTRSVLYFGRNGTGPFCYGEGTSDQSLAGQATSDGSVYCYDPTDSSKGQHAYPYNSQVWAYDMNDFAAVAAGSKQPWQVVPYATWTISLPIADDDGQLSSVAYDSAHQLIYLVQPGTDPDGYNYRPLIQVMQIAIAAPGGTVPAAPTNLTATAQATSIGLAWQDNASNATGYLVERSTNGTSFSQLATLGATATSYADASVTAGQQYWYRVSASNSAGSSGCSNVVCVTATQPAPTVPATPSGETATVQGTAIALAWTDNATNETAYALDRALGTGGSFARLANLAANSVKFTDSTVTAGQQYCYRVSASNTAGSSGYSNVACATVPLASPSVPATPSGATATVQGSAIAVGWVDNATNETAYAVDRALGTAGSFTRLANLAANSVAYTDSTVTAGQQYCYRASASNSAGSSGYSNVACAMVPLAGTTTVDFDNPAPPGSSGTWMTTFGGINWGTQQWKWWSAEAGEDPTNHVDFGASGVTSRKFSFSPAPQTLVSVTFVSMTSGIVTISDNNGQKTAVAVVADQAVVAVLGWTKASTTVTVTSALGWNMAITALSYK